MTVTALSPPPASRAVAPRSAAVVTAGAAAVAAVLALTAASLWVVLPDDASVTNWGLAWAGFDALVAVTALLTAVLLRRGDVRAPLAAAAVSALLVADAWFDVTTSGGSGLAVAEALLVELPLAVAAAALAVRMLGPLRPDPPARSGG